jgi:FlaG/FlaF family flagellin (archaellin)
VYGCERFKTRTGHQLQFVEEDKGGSKDGVHVETSGGHQLQMNDSDTKIGMTSTGDIGIKSGRTGMSNKISLNAGEIDLTGITKITLTVGCEYDRANSSWYHD